MKSETQTWDVFGLRPQVNIQTILTPDRIQEIRQNVAKQNKNSEYQINLSKYRHSRIVTVLFAYCDFCIVLLNNTSPGIVIFLHIMSI